MAAHPAGPSGSSSQSGPIRNKGSTPSLVGHGYTFGSQASNNPPEPSQSEPMMSPYSEIGPTATSAEQPPGPFSQDAQSLTRPSPAASTSSAQSVSHSGISNIPWSKAGGAALDDTQSRKDSNATTDSEDTNNEELSSRGSGHGSAAPSAPTTPFGIPLTYNLGRRTSVSAESLDPTLAQPLNKIVIPKTASQRARIEASIKGNLLFRNLDEDQHNDVLNAMKEVRVQQNTEVIVQGAVGDFFYVVEAGEFEVWVKPQASHRYDPATKRTISDQHPPKMVARIDSGGSFGELALMYNAPRAATVISVSPTSTLWALDRVTFRSILMEHSSRKRKMYEHFLGEVNILVSLEPHERAKIADALEEKVYEEGEAVVIEGEVGKNFYIIESGQAQVLKRQSNGHDEEVSNLGRGDYFGGAALWMSSNCDEWLI